MKLRSAVALTVLALAAGHGAMVTPRPRNSIDYLLGINPSYCSNATGSKCENGQSAFWYSQGW